MYASQYIISFIHRAKTCLHSGISLTLSKGFYQERGVGGSSPCNEVRAALEVSHSVITSSRRQTSEAGASQ